MWTRWPEGLDSMLYRSTTGLVPNGPSRSISKFHAIIPKRGCLIIEGNDTFIILMMGYIAYIILRCNLFCEVFIFSFDLSAMKDFS